MGWLLGGADNRADAGLSSKRGRPPNLEGARSAEGSARAIPHRTAVRIPPAFPALPKPERTNSQSLRAAVMPQDRRSPPSATQDTNQPPIVRPHSATLSPSAFLVGCCDRSSSPPSQRRNPTAAAAILRTCGRPAVRSARIRTQRVDHPPPRSGIHTAASSGRGSAAVLLAPCSAPTATCAVARERSSPRRARTLPPFSIPWRQHKPTPPQH